ncbi:MAG: hypothetical protein ACP5N9_03575 [Candidatus Bilamarchaeum sp.]
MDFIKTLLNDRRMLAVSGLFILLAAMILIYPKLSGILLIGGLIVLGSLSLMWKEPNLRIAGMALLVLLAIINIYANGMKFGIDFSGGTRIPVILDHPVDSTTMNELVQTIKTRASVLGLTEVKVRAIGESEINVETPASDEETIRYIEQTLSHQGVYQGIVDGKLAVSGENIYSSGIRALSQAELIRPGISTPPDWGVSFTVDNEGAEMFARAAKGKADYPIYMFLDRPTDAVIFFSRDQLTDTNISAKDGIYAIRNALKYEGGNISAYITDEIPSNLSATTNKTKAIISKDANSTTKALLVSKGFRISEVEAETMKAQYAVSSIGEITLAKLEAVGLLSAPFLGGEITNGIPSHSFSISGYVEPTYTGNAKAIEANNRVKSIESILKGGSLPVQISIGSRTVLPSTLGGTFLELSLGGIVASLILISIFIGLRYQNMAATAPIVLISVGELIILISILGSFTIDLAAMAGIIAAIGVGVDAQIVITDEILKKDDEHHTTSEKVDMAFGIIRTNAIVAICSMIPLLFSGLVEVIGFAISTILGALLGYLLTRPSYAAIVEKVLIAEGKTAK